MNLLSTLPTLADVDLEKFPTVNIEEITDRLEVMRKQEDTTYFCTDYLKTATSPTMIDELCRTKMLTWCFQLVDFGKFKRDTVVIATSYLDFFLSSGAPRAMNAIENRKEYQLACMTTLYMAVKLHEPAEMDTTALAILSQNTYGAKDFAQMEFDILSALNWRVHGPTVLCFLEYFIALISTGSIQNKDATKILQHISKQYAELTLGDYYFVTQKPSTVAIAIIFTSLKHISPDLLNEIDRHSFFSNIATASKINLNSPEICLARERLPSIPNELANVEFSVTSTAPCKVGRDSTLASSNISVNSSPICVSAGMKKIKNQRKCITHTRRELNAWNMYK